MSLVAGLVLAILAALMGCQTTPDTGTPSVRAYDQVISGDTVTIDRVVSSGSGWIVIHAQQQGRPGPVIGYAAVKDGVNRRVMVKVDAARTTGVLYAILNTDAGVAGTYEFPGADIPVTVADKIVGRQFSLNTPAESSSMGGGGY